MPLSITLSEDALKTTTKIAIGFGAAVLLVLLLVLVLFSTFRQNENAVAWQKHTLVVIGAADDLLSSLKDAETGQRGYLATGDEVFLEPYLVAQDRIAPQLAALRRLTQDNPVQQQRLDVMASLLSARLALLAQSIALGRDQHREAALEIMRSGRGKKLMDELRVQTRDLTRMEEDLLAQREAQYQTSAHRLMVLIVVTGLAVVLVSLVSSWLTYRESRRRITIQEQTNQELEQRVRERTESLQLERDKLAAIFDNASMGLVLTDAQGGDITMNPAALKFHGFDSLEDMKLRVEDYANDWELRTADGRVMPYEEWPLVRAIHGDYINDFEIGYRRLKDGHQKVCNLTSIPVRNSRGEVIYIVITLFDITERKQAELEIIKLNAELEQRVAERTAQLNASSTRIQTILDTIADGILTINQSGIVETINPAAERLFGYAAAEVIGHNVKMLMPEPHRSQHDGYIEHYLTTDEARVIGIGREVTGQRKDGSPFAMYLAVNEMLLDGQRHFTGIVHDITERKQMVETLQKSSERLRLALDAANQAWFDLDVQTGAVHVSPEYVRLIGFDHEDFQSTLQNWFDNMHPDDREAVRATYQACLNSGEPGAMEYRRRNKSGAWQWMYSVGRVVEWDDAHKPVQMIGIHMDISERKLAEQALLAAKEQAELANRAKDSFLATMSHEIRTPLTGMLGMLEVLSLTPLDHDQSETLKTVWDSSRSLLRIVNDILDWSKIEEGKLELSPQSTSIPSMLQEVVNTYSRVASSKSLFLSQHADHRLSAAHLVDALRLSQVLNNFVSNALKFTRHGEIELRAELLEQLDSGERVRFSVKDTGIGIAPEVQQHLFQRYMQESAETARMYGGTGLGLSICRRLVELLDGQLELVSTPGQGSTFSVTVVLPVSAAPGETIATVAPDVAPRKIEPLFDPGADAPLVLAVDDHPTNRDLLARQIRLLGLRAETAENGKVALSLWREGRFALVITDCHMPEMDGYAFAREIRRIEAGDNLPHTPLIAWTANALPQEEALCRDAGMDALLVKPANLTQLKTMLAAWLPHVVADRSQTAPATPHARQDASCPIDYAELGQVVSDRAEQIQVLRDFQAHIRADRLKLRELLEQGDHASAERSAHRMKGSSGMVGATELAHACAALEQAAHADDIAAARAAMVVLEAAFGRLETYLAGLSVAH